MYCKTADYPHFHPLGLNTAAYHTTLRSENGRIESIIAILNKNNLALSASVYLINLTVTMCNIICEDVKLKLSSVHLTEIPQKHDIP